MKKNWKTTLGGILMALGGLMASVSDPSWFPQVGAIFLGLGGLLTGSQAQDHAEKQIEEGVDDA